MKRLAIISVVLSGCLLGRALANGTGGGLPAKEAAANAAITTELQKIITEHYEKRGLKPPVALQKSLDEALAAVQPSASTAALKESLAAIFFGQFGLKDMVLYRDEQMFRAMHDNITSSSTAPGCRLPIWFQRRGARMFVSDILIPGAQIDSLKKGDEVISIDGKPFDSSAFYAAKEPCPRVKIAFRHEPWDKIEELTVRMLRGDYPSILLAATHASKHTVTIAGKSIGYLRLWTDGDDRILDVLKDAAKEFDSQTQSWILDLRGGAESGELALTRFLKSDAAGKDKVPTKPIYVLIDHTTTGARALLAARLQQRQLATLIGAPSHGIHLPLFHYFFMDNNWMVSLPATEVKDGPSAVLGELHPDVAMDDTLVYAGGVDATLQKALQMAAHG